MVMASHLVRYDGLVQNAIDIITKCESYFMQQKLISQCVRFFIKKCVSFVKKCHAYYKMDRYKIVDMRYDNNTFSKKMHR